LGLKKKVNGEPKLIIQQLNFELIRIFDDKPQLLQNLQTTYEVLTGKANDNKLVNDSDANSETANLNA
jgi:hypothetical protein